MSPVPRPRFVLEGRGNRVLLVVVIILLVALVKPWGQAGTTAPVPSQATATTPSPSLPRPTTDPADSFSRTYDPLVFGDHELQPAWGLWPAGYLVSFGFAMRAESSSPPSGAPASSEAAADPRTPIWPAAIDIPSGNHLLLIGINTPNGYSLDRIDLVRRQTDGSVSEVAVQRLPSPWPSHFTVIAIDNGSGGPRLDFWAPGDYRLELTIDPGPIDRSIEVRVEPPTVFPAHSPAASVSP